MSRTRIQMRRPDDWHVHLRQGEALRTTVPLTARQFARALVMPNVSPPIRSGEQAMVYRGLLQDALSAEQFDPLMTIQLTPETTAEDIAEAGRLGVTAVKLYPLGVTTGASVGGVTDFFSLGPAYSKMQEVGLVLCVHGEAPGEPALDREVAFLGTVQALAERYPDLRVVLEHISTAEAVDVVMATQNLGATITAHHMVLTLDDVIGDAGLQPHHFCRPIAKTLADREALVRAATSGHPSFFFGSDSAPHTRRRKESVRAPAGVFTAPIAIPLLAEVFESVGRLDALEAFTSVNGALFYGLPLNGGCLELERRPWTVPEALGEFVPLRAGETMSWSVVP